MLADAALDTIDAVALSAVHGASKIKAKIEAPLNKLPVFKKDIKDVHKQETFKHKHKVLLSICPLNLEGPPPSFSLCHFFTCAN
jgi:hypothetical protein